MSLLVSLMSVALLATGAQEEAGTVIYGSTADSRACYRYAARGTVSTEAIARCSTAMESAVTPRNRTASQANRGVVYYNNGQFAEALADFTAVIERSPPHALHYLNRGLTFEQMAQTRPRYEAQARADYERALALSPGNGTARRRLTELDKPRLERTPLRRRIIS